MKNTITRRILMRLNSINLKGSKNGQAMPYLLVSMVILIICWAMMVNTAKLLHDRMIIQNAADNAALSVAAYKARVLNELRYTNFLIGCLLRDGIPGFTWGIATEEKPFWEFFGGIFNYDGFGFSGSSYGSCPHSTFGFLPMMFHDNQKHVGSIFDMSHEGCPGMDTGFMSSSKNVERISQMVQGLIKLQDAIRLPFPM